MLSLYWIHYCMLNGIGYFLNSTFRYFELSERATFGGDQPKVVSRSIKCVAIDGFSPHLASRAITIAV